MRIVETYDPAPAEYSDATGTRTWPVVALIEDDDGFRWLIAATQITEHHWRRALAAGAAGVTQAAPGRGWHSATAERYADLREHGGELIASTDMPTLIALREQEAAARAPRRAAGFVNLHTHTEHSPVDAISRIPQLVQIAAEQGAGALGITDHGYCSGHPELQIQAAAVGIKPVFGIEAYFVDDVEQRGSDQYDYWHLILLARTDEGLRNLWAASTESFRRGFYGKPRMDWDILGRHSEGLVATTACLGGPIAEALKRGDVDTAAARLTRLKGIFEDRLYAELHVYPTEEQRFVNKNLADLAAIFEIPLVAAADSHYPRPEDHERHQVWLAAATRKDIGETGMFTSGRFHMHTADDIRAALDYMRPEQVEEAIASTVAIAKAAEAEIRTRKVLPLYSPKSTYDSDAEQLRKTALANWSKVEPRITDETSKRLYTERFEREMSLLKAQKFCGYFLIVADFIGWAKGQGILVGPGRGSGGGSLVAYLMGITEMNSVRWDLPFERFLTPGRESLPDFDTDFPASKRPDIFAYLAQRWGSENVVSIGTVSRLRNRGVAKELERAMRPMLPDGSFDDMVKVSKIIEEAEAGTAGLGLSWEDLWDQHGDQLAEYRMRYPNLFDHADHLVGLLKTYGKHAAGAVISTDEPLTGVMPLRGGEDGSRMITQFDDDAVEMQGYIKYDVLTLTTLDTIQMTIDAIEERWGHRLNLYSFDNELDDPIVWDMLCAGDVLGCFQIETSLGIRMVRDMQPRNIADLADVITLVRPGPRNSGITRTYLARRNGEDGVTVPDERLREVLAPTYGTMIYQEQVLAICRIIAGYNDLEADDIRKILGKKKIDKVDAAGRDFVARAIERGMSRNAALMLWGQMAEFSKYAFGKAHAYAYGLLCYWTAFLKIHYPVEFMAATLSTVKDERLPVFVKESRRIGVPVLAPDINISGTGFTIDNASVRYGISSLKGVGEAAAAEIIAHQPYTSIEDLAERTSSKAVTRGTIGTLALAGAFDTLYPHRAALVARLKAEASGEATRCRFKTDDVPEGELPCRFDWASEPPLVNPKTGKKLKPKPPPKRCVKSCRQYAAPEPFDPEAVPRYTPEQIGAIERELFGRHLTYSPFDVIANRVTRDEFRHVAETAETAYGTHLLLAYVEDVAPRTSKNGLRMGRITLATEGPDLEAVIFSTLWEKLDPDALRGRLVAAEVQHTDRGMNVKSIELL